MLLLVQKGFGSLFSDSSRYIEVLMTVLAFSLTSIFDPIGTFIGTGRATGIFTDEDLKDMETSHGFSSKMDKALFADMIATPIGAIFEHQIQLFMWNLQPELVQGTYWSCICCNGNYVCCLKFILTTSCNCSNTSNCTNLDYCWDDDAWFI